MTDNAANDLQRAHNMFSIDNDVEYGVVIVSRISKRLARLTREFDYGVTSRDDAS